MRNKTFSRTIVALLVSLLSAFLVTFISSSPASAATCASSVSTYLTPGTAYITDYGSKYPNSPKHIYPGQAITFKLPYSMKAGYSLSGFSGDFTNKFSMDSFAGNDVISDYKITQSVTVTWWSVGTPPVQQSCTINVTWSAGKVEIFEPQGFDSPTNVLDGFDGVQVKISGDKSFAGTTTVTFTMTAKDWLGNIIKLQPKAYGKIRYSLNGIEQLAAVPIAEGTGSVTLKNKDLYFDVFNDSKCDLSLKIESLFNWFERECKSDWYDSDSQVDFVSIATKNNSGLNRVSDVRFISDNTNIWKNASNYPIGFDPFNWTYQTPIYKWVVKGPKPVPLNKVWSSGVSNYKVDKSAPGATYAGYYTFKDSQFSVNSGLVTGGICQPDKLSSCLNYNGLTGAVSMFNPIFMDKYIPLPDSIEGVGGKTYFVLNSTSYSIADTYDNAFYGLSCPVESTGINIRFVDWGQALWDDNQYKIMRSKQDTVVFQVNNREYYTGFTPQSYYALPQTGLTFSYTPYSGGPNPDGIDRRSGSIEYLDMLYQRGMFNGGGWSAAAKLADPGWYCVMPSTLKGTAKVDLNMKITNDDLGLAVYTTTQSPVLQNLTVYDSADKKRRVFAKNISLEIWTNTGTNAKPVLGAKKKTIAPFTNCLTYAGSTLSLPAAKYRLGTNDKINTCLKNLNLPLMPVGKYVVKVLWDGKENGYAVYKPTDNVTSIGKQSRFAFEVVQEFQCTFDDTGAESIWVNYLDKNNSLQTSKGTAATITRGVGSTQGYPDMLLTYPNVDANDFVGIIYDAPNIDPAMNGKIRAVTKIYDEVLTNGAVIVSTPREPEEVRLFQLNKVTEILRNGTNRYMFGDYEVLGLKKAVSTGASDDMFHDQLKVYWPSTVSNPSTNTRIPLRLEREINVYGWAWSMGKAGQLELKKDWHTCLDSPRTGKLTIISSQVNQ